MAARAAGSSLISMTLRVVSRLTTASAMRSAISSRRGIPRESTSVQRGVSRKRRQHDGHACAFAGCRVRTHRTAVGFDQRFYDRQTETGAGTERVGAAGAIVRLEHPGALLGRNAGPLVLDLDG